MATLLATAAAGLRALGTARVARAVARADEGPARAAAQRRLAAHLAEARGISAKVGQWLAGAVGGDAYAGCQEDLQPLPWSAIAGTVDAACAGQSWWPGAVVDGRGHAASLGQVHRAVLADGRVVAVKVRYPGISEAVDAELSALELVPMLGPPRRYGIDAEAWRAMLRTTLTAELDYRREADAIRDFPEASGVHLPTVLHATACVLVMSWEDGCQVASVAGWPQARRDAAGDALLTAWLRQAAAGTVHADLHPGNVRVRADGTWVFYDLGCTAAITPGAWRGLAGLIAATAADAPGDARSGLVAAGFDPARLDLVGAALQPAVAAALAPFAAEGRFAARVWQPGTAVAQALGEERWWFRAAGPPSFLLPMRSWAGLWRLLGAIDARVDARACLARALPRSDAGQAGIVTAESSPGMQARHLRVRVVRHGVEVVRLDLPSAAAGRIGGLMDEETLRRLAVRGLDPDALGRDAVERGLTPGCIFRDDDGQRLVEVSLS